MSKQIPVEVGFTFNYIDKRLKYTSKDFGIKSIPYGESDDVQADALPAYEEELSHVKDVLHEATNSFNDTNIDTGNEINIESISDEWISLYNYDEKGSKLTVEIEVAVHLNLTIPTDDMLSTDEHYEMGFICDKASEFVHELSSLSNGAAKLDYCSYD